MGKATIAALDGAVNTLLTPTTMGGEKFHITVTIDNKKAPENQALLDFFATRNLIFVQHEMAVRRTVAARHSRLKFFCHVRPLKMPPIVGFSSAGICVDAPRVVDCDPIPFRGFESRLLIRMATIEELVEANAISRIQVEMHPRDQALRLLYGTPGFIAWLGELAKGSQPERRLGEATPAEQVDDLFNTFLAGQPLVYMKQFRSIRAEKNAVWELKTPDIRIFGWFLQKDCFVCVFGNWADVIKDHDLYRGYRIAIRRLRRELGVDETLCVQGVTPGDVLSL